MEMFIDQKPDKKRTYSGIMVVLVLLSRVRPRLKLRLTWTAIVSRLAAEE